jgi:hypothetical protein
MISYLRRMGDTEKLLITQDSKSHQSLEISSWFHTWSVVTQSWRLH